MAVTIHRHTVDELTDGNRPDAMNTPDGDLRQALRIGSDQLDDIAAETLDLAAWGVVEQYTGRLVASRETTLIVEVSGRAEVVEAAGSWTPEPSSVDMIELWTAAGGWDDVTDDTEQVTPTGGYRLDVGWWRIVTTQGEHPPAELTEAHWRIAAYLFDTDPAAMNRDRSNLVRLSGAAALLGPYCTRGARSIGGA